MSTLSEYKIAVHKKGFNISMMINTFKKKQREMKSTREIPESVLCEVCKEYLMRGDSVRSGFPYFMKVLNMKMDDYQSNLIQTDHKEKAFGKMPTNIKEAMLSAIGG